MIPTSHLSEHTLYTKANCLWCSPGVNTGTLALVLYINDITISLHQDKIVKHAGDTVIFYSDKDAEVIQTVLNNEFSSMTNKYKINHKYKTRKNRSNNFWKKQTFVLAEQSTVENSEQF